MREMKDDELLIRMPVRVLVVGTKPNASGGEDLPDCIWVDVDGERALCLFTDIDHAHRYRHETGLAEDNVSVAMNSDPRSVVRLLKENQSAGMTAVVVDPAGLNKPCRKIAIQAVIDSLEQSPAGLPP